MSPASSSAPAPEASQELGAALDEFEAAEAEVREMIESTPRFRERPDHRAQAYVALAEARAMAYNMIIAPRTDIPRVFSQSSWHSYLFTLGQNCQDFRYGSTLLDGARSYRLTGNLGDLKLLLVQVHSHPLGHPDSEEIGNYDFHQLEHADDGSFEVALGGKEPNGGKRDWIRLEESSGHNFIVIRRILGDIADDAGRLRIETEGDPPPPRYNDPADAAQRLQLAAGFMRFLVRDWAVGIYDLYLKAAGGKNKLALIPGEELATDLVGSPSTTYGLGIYEIEPGEAMVVEWDPPDSAYWSWQVGDVWCKSFDFFNYQTDVNMNSAHLGADGRFRAVVAAEDPGVPNWLDTLGHLEGSLVMRNYRGKAETSQPSLEKVALSEVRERLPAETPPVSPEERRAALEQRRLKYLTAFGD